MSLTTKYVKHYVTPIGRMVAWVSPGAGKWIIKRGRVNYGGMKNFSPRPTVEWSMCRN